MSNDPVIVERAFNVPVHQLWNALTNSDEMKKWYFDLPGFKAERGYKFSFKGGPPDGIQYLHQCEVTEALTDRKLSYTWRYEGYPGVSTVHFELFEHEGQTLLRVTHEGLDTFPADNRDLQRGNFEKGWNAIVNESLKQYLEQPST